MLSLRTHIMISAGIMAVIIMLAMIVFLGLTVALMLSLVPVMVKLVLGVQAGIGNAGHPVVAAMIAHERVIVFVLWGLIALGLVIAVPAAIIDGAFD